MRKIEIIEKNQHTKEITENATVMDYFCVCVRDKSNKNEFMRMINHVRTCKQIYLPFELVSICGMNETGSLTNDDEESPVKW